MHTTETNTEAAARLIVSNLGKGVSPQKLGQQIAADVAALNVHRHTPAALADMAAMLATLAEEVAKAACDANHARTRDVRCIAIYGQDPANVRDLADTCQYLEKACHSYAADIAQAVRRL